MTGISNIIGKKRQSLIRFPTSINYALIEPPKLRDITRVKRSDTDSSSGTSPGGSSESLNDSDTPLINLKPRKQQDLTKLPPPRTNTRSKNTIWYRPNPTIQDFANQPTTQHTTAVWEEGPTHINRGATIAFHEIHPPETHTPTITEPNIQEPPVQVPNTTRQPDIPKRYPSTFTINKKPDLTKPHNIPVKNEINKNKINYYRGPLVNPPVRRPTELRPGSANYVGAGLGHIGNDTFTTAGTLLDEMYKHKQMQDQIFLQQEFQRTYGSLDALFEQLIKQFDDKSEALRLRYFNTKSWEERIQIRTELNELLDRFMNGKIHTITGSYQDDLIWQAHLRAYYEVFEQHMDYYDNELEQEIAHSIDDAEADAVSNDSIEVDAVPETTVNSRYNASWFISNLERLHNEGIKGKFSVI